MRHSIAPTALAVLCALVASPAAQSAGVQAVAETSWHYTASDPTKSDHAQLGSTSETPGEVVRQVDTCGAQPKGGHCSTIGTPGFEPPESVTRPGWTYSGGPPSNWTPNALVSEASASFGVTRVRAFAAGLDCPIGPCSSNASALSRGETAFASASFIDEFTYFGPATVVTAWLHVDGRWAGGGAFSYVAGLDTGDGIGVGTSSMAAVRTCNPDEDCSDLPPTTLVLAPDAPGGDSGRFDLMLAVPIQLDDQTSFRFGGVMTALAGDAPANASALVDAFNTARLERFELPSGARLIAASGTAYTISSVPEPGSLALWLVGALVGGGLARRRRPA